MSEYFVTTAEMKVPLLEMHRCKPIKNAPYGLDLFVHRPLNDWNMRTIVNDAWKVTEKSTGLAVSQPQSTQKAAIAQALERLKTLGKEKTKQSIELGLSNTKNIPLPSEAEFWGGKPAELLSA